MSAQITKRSALAALSGTVAAACSPLRLFATLSPMERAIPVGRCPASGAGARQRLDVYAPRRGPQAAPLAVFFYGGSWDSGRRQDYSWVGRALASRGVGTAWPVARPIVACEGAQARLPSQLKRVWQRR